jgi:hypothetical protein
VFLNLAERRGGTGRQADAAVHIRFERTGKDWNVSFVDNGPGLDATGRACRPTALPRRRTGSSGWVVGVRHRIAEQQGGHLDVDDAAGAGTDQAPAALTRKLNTQSLGFSILYSRLR